MYCTPIYPMSLQSRGGDPEIINKILSYYVLRPFFRRLLLHSISISHSFYDSASHRGCMRILVYTSGGARAIRVHQ